MSNPSRFSFFSRLSFVLACAACAGPEPATRSRSGPVAATSLLGEPLHAPAFGPARRAELERQLAEARERYLAEPRVEDNAIWYGRRLAYLGRYSEAIGVYTRALVWHPRSSKVLRHRGHRYITTRRFAEAERDLARAALLVRGTPDEVEPDGAPNARGLPRSTHQSNVWYHLGLARYLQGNFRGALDAYRECLEVSRVNDDMLCATSHWLYMTLRRLGRDAEAAAVIGPIREDMDVIENHGYHELLLMYRGERDPELLRATNGDGVTSATVGYGVGNYYLVEGDAERARAIFEEVLAGGTWAAFGSIAAEAEVARARGR